MSITREEIITTAESYGFSLWSTERDNTRTQYHFMDKYGINLWVDCENNFRMEYLIPKSIFRFTCPECSPFYNSDHFKKLYLKFKREVVDCWSHIN